MAICHTPSPFSYPPHNTPTLSEIRTSQTTLSTEYREGVKRSRVEKERAGATHGSAARSAHPIMVIVIDRSRRASESRVRRAHVRNSSWS